MPTRKPNKYIIDEKLNICRIATSLTKSLNKDLKLWKLDVIGDIQVHDFEVIIDYDKNLIKMLEENYLIFYNSAADIQRSKRKNPRPVANDLYNGYFWAWHIHTKRRSPLGRVLWEYCYGKRELLDTFVVDHNNDMHNLCTFSNLALLSPQQNKAKIKYYMRHCGDLNVTMISHPYNRYIHAIRFKDNANGKQELLIYDTRNGIDLLLDDINTFKKVFGADESKFRQHFDELKSNNGNYIAHSEQATTGDMFIDELFHYCVDWKSIDELIKSGGNDFRLAPAV